MICFGILFVWAIIVFATRAQQPDYGYFPDTGSDSSCSTCVTGVTAGVLGAVAATCAAASWFTFGVACAIAVASAPLAIYVGQYTCYHSTACCPIGCGFTGNPGLCCRGGEKCLNGLAGLCCVAGKEPCAGQQCCADAQSCIAGGPSKGTCCRDSQLCGMFCCDGATWATCQNAAAGSQELACCPSDAVCGSICCRSPGTLGGTCANAATGLCCNFGEEDCGGVCCGQGNCENGKCTGCTYGRCVGTNSAGCQAGFTSRDDPPDGCCRAIIN